MLVEVKPIKSEADYEDALGEIEKLFNAKPETSEGDRLEILASLVEDFESRGLARTGNSTGKPGSSVGSSEPQTP